MVRERRQGGGLAAGSGRQAMGCGRLEVAATEKSTLRRDLSSHTFCATIIAASKMGCQLERSKCMPVSERRRSV